MKTTFTMTKYKIDVGEIQTIKKYETFDEYLNGCRKFHSLQNSQLGRSGEQVQSFEKLSSNFSSLSQQEIPSHNNMMGISSKNKKITRKTINASIWLCNNHPLTLDSFIPLLQVLSFSSKQIAKFKDYLMKYKLPPGSFPLRAKIPIFFTMKAAFSLQNLSLNPNDFPSELFDVDQFYIKQRFIAQ